MSDEVSAPETQETRAADAAEASTVLTAQENTADDAGQAAQAAEQGSSEGEKTEVEASQEEDNTEKQALTIDVPEGMEAFKGDFDKFATDMNDWIKANPKATVQDALSEAANRQARLAAETQAAAVQEIEDQVNEWEAAARSDKEYGGDAFDANVATAIKGLEAVGTPELKELLNQSRLGSHPEVIRAFHKVGKMMSDASIIGDGIGASDADRTAARYPTSTG